MVLQWGWWIFYNGVITHLEPDILECEVKWALESITMKKANGRWWNSSWAVSNPKKWCCKSAALNMPANLENSAVVTGLGKVFIPILKKGNAKDCSNYRTIALISRTSKVMLKILQARLQQYVNRKFSDFKLVLEKAEKSETKLPTSAGSWKKQGN